MKFLTGSSFPPKAFNTSCPTIPPTMAAEGGNSNPIVEAMRLEAIEVRSDGVGHSDGVWAYEFTAGTRSAADTPRDGNRVAAVVFSASAVRAAEGEAICVWKRADIGFIIGLVLHVKVRLRMKETDWESTRYQERSFWVREEWLWTICESKLGRRERRSGGF